MTTTSTELDIRRVRHRLQMRKLTVIGAAMISPHMRRLTLSGESLADLHSEGFDDHVKLLLPAPGTASLALPPLGADGLPDWAGSGLARPVARDYTPRRIDRAARLLEIDIALHGGGPAALWAAQVAIGDSAVIGGPRGSMVVPTDLAWQWLIGDESALPAIARRLEELGPQVKVAVVIETEADEALPALALGEGRSLVHVLRPAGGTAEQLAAPLLAALRALPAPAGRGHAFVAAESQTVKAVRDLLVGQHGLGKGQLRASAYWRRGASGFHENLDA